MEWLKSGGVGKLQRSSNQPTTTTRRKSQDSLRANVLDALRTLGRPPPRCDEDASILKDTVYSSDGYNFSKTSPSQSIISDCINLPNVGDGVPLMKCLGRRDRKLLKSLGAAQVQPDNGDASAFASTEQYTALVHRMVIAGIVSLSFSKPRVVNSVFAVPKKNQRQRLIVNAVPANRAMDEPLQTELPSPALFGSLYINPSDTLYCAKNDLSDYYYQCILPANMRDLLGLPPVRASALGWKCVAPEALVYPTFLRMPMGWSWSAYFAQAAHVRAIRSSSKSLGVRLLSSQDHSFRLGATPVVGVYLDDGWILGTSRDPVETAWKAFIAAWRTLGFNLRDSKCEPPATSIEVLGIA